MAKDVSAFLMWTAEPNLQGRHKAVSGGSIVPKNNMATLLAAEVEVLTQHFIDDIFVAYRCPDNASTSRLDGGIKTGIVMGQNDSLANGKHPIALTGRVYVYCDGSNAAIEPGDLLTSSDTPGHAMKAIDAERSHGTVIGKAMTGLRAREKGLVLVLVNLQ